MYIEISVKILNYIFFQYVICKARLVIAGKTDLIVSDGYVLSIYV